jgi:ribosome-associated protein
MRLARIRAEVANDNRADNLCEKQAGSHGGGSPRGRFTTPEGGPLKLATTGQTLQLPALQRACICARVAADNKARDIVVLDMRSITPLYDFFVIATGNSRRQIHTITEEIDDSMREVGDLRLSVEGYEASKWVVQDYGDVVVHLFTPETREYYGLEELWADAPRVEWEFEG